MEQAAGPRFDARDYVRIIRKRKWLVVAISAIFALVGSLIAMSGKREYRASALVLIKQPTEGLFWLGATAPEKRRRTISMETQARIAQSEPCARKTAERLAAATDSRLSYAVDVTAILRSISTSVIPPDVLRIQARSDRYGLAIALANETARSFVLISGEYQRKEESDATKFLEEQLAASERELSDAAKRMTEYQRATGLLAADAGTAYIQSALDTFRSEKARAETELAQVQATAKKFEELIGGTASATVREVPVVNPVRQALTQALQNDQLALTRLRAQYTDQYPAVQSLLARISETEARVAELPATIKEPQVQTNSVLQTAESQLESQRVTARRLQAQIASYDRAINNLHQEARELVDKENELAGLQDEKLLARDRHRALLQELSVKRLEEATTSEGDAIIIDRAVSAEEIGPDFGKTVVFAVFLGIFAGIALALVLETLDDTIHSPEDITRYTPAAFLGIVPRTEEVGEQLVTIAAPKSPPAEAYRTLRSNINFALVESPARTFVVTSAGAGEGKSCIAANLAVAFAQAGQSVIIVDSDLRRPVQHHLFECEAIPGLTNVLVGEMTIGELLQETGVPNLRLLASGPLPPNPAELIDSAAMDDVIAQLGAMADIVLFDSPPAIMLTDAVILSSKVERVILVAEAGQVTRDAFGEMLRLIQHARGTILGAVLNKLRLTPGDYYYYYYYYYYSDSSREPTRRPPGKAAPPGAETSAAEVEEQPLLPWEQPEWLREDSQERGETPVPLVEPPDAEMREPFGEGPNAADEPAPTPPEEPEAETEPLLEPPSLEESRDDEEPPPMPWDRPPPRDQQ